MRMKIIYPGLFIGLLILAAVAQWPAAALAPWLESASGGQWRLAAASGTLWHGGGILLVRTPGGSAWRNIQSVGWQIRFGELLRGRFTIDLAPEQGALRLIATPGRITAESLDITLPANSIAAFLPGALNRYGWTGMLHGRGKTFSCDWHGQDCRGDIELLWNDAAVTEIVGPALGDYRVSLTGAGPVLRVAIDTLGGRLKIKANGEIGGGGRINLHGEAMTVATPNSVNNESNENNESLNALLSTLGSSVGDGKYRIDYQEAGVAPR